MANPRSIADYCQAVGKTLDTVGIPCKFCGNTLDYYDCVSFDLKGLFLLWRDFSCFAACRSCCHLLGVAELLYFYEGSYSTRDVIVLENKPLSAICIRCAGCLKSLSLPEKIVSGSLARIHKVRGQWRSICMFCTP